MSHIITSGRVEFLSPGMWSLVRAPESSLNACNTLYIRALSQENLPSDGYQAIVKFWFAQLPRLDADLLLYCPQATKSDFLRTKPIF